MLNFDQCWQALERRDRAQDGRFYFGVTTTGVYCRPSCPARHPLRGNVRFYETPQQAERDGLRPCLRCHPLAAAADPYAERVRELCRFIDSHAGEPLQLRDLARRASLSPFHLQRSFKAIAGVTPKQYLEAARLRALKSTLKRASVADAVYEAGFNSPSRVYERADTRLGMTPSQYRRGGEGVIITYAFAQSPVGLMMIGATDRGLCSVQFGDSREDLLAALEREYPQALVEPMRRPADPVFRKWMDALNAHLAGRQPRLDLPLDIRATAFQMLVWNYLQTIPYGEVQSYGEVAKAIGRPKAVRAVARACASNRVAVVIPCHRVIRGTGELGGYRWGLARMRALLDRERAAARRAS
jgi:AraC family transcriptional regulator, regulatory protein of adaptative response / methylated-DNA-[protein]-cysteine methyltransferase